VYPYGNTVGVKGLMGNPMTELHGVAAVRVHAMSLATRHERTHSALTLASKAGTRITIALVDSR